MDTKSAVKKIWKECFDDSAEYMDMFFSQVYDPAHVMVSDVDGKTVSSLLLQPFAINFHGVELPANYICGAATMPRFRMQGIMSELIRSALNRCYREGALLCCLIPAHSYLYAYYRNFGFCPAFYTRLCSYTDVHPFSHEGVYNPVAELDTDRAYDFFNRMMHKRPSTIQHSRRQYSQILLDNALCGGVSAAVESPDGEIRAMAFAVPDSGQIVVTDMLAEDDDAENAVLGIVLRSFEGMSMRVLAYYGDRPLELRPRGMARITNVMLCLTAIATAHPKLNITIKITDPIIAENNRVFRVKDGKVTDFPHEQYSGRLDYDITPEVFASIVFGNKVTADILDFPSVRPFMSLMLD